jgi:alpha-soluble NSF attachment protein
MSEHQAHDLLLQAEKKLNSWTWFNSKNKHEDAAEMYEKAGNTFKLAQRCSVCSLFFFLVYYIYFTFREGSW